MGLLWGLLVLLVVGAIAGFIARALVPGRDAMSFGQTVLLGVVGSFVGGLLGALLFGKDGRGFGEGLLQTSGILGSVLGAIIALVVYNAVTGRKRNRSHA
jgi:uncharacterized membrane protein YeaQ/YmgE (transglycosylase-associated protein family)